MGPGRRFPTTVSRTTQVNYSNRGNQFRDLGKTGRRLELSAHLCRHRWRGIRLQIYNQTTKTYVFDSAGLENGESILFKWPPACRIGDVTP